MDDYELGEDLEEVEVISLDGDDDFGEELDDEDATPFNHDQIPDIDVVDLSILTFNKHSKSVFCCDISKDGQFAITGGEDDNAFLWSLSTGEVIFECTGHKDSVTCVGFNHDNEFLVTGDMAGMIQVWSFKEKKLIWCYEGDDMEMVMWHPLANVLIVGSQSGGIYIWQVPQGNCKVLPSHGSAFSSGKILPDGKRVLAGYEDGQVKLWDIKSTSVIWTFADPQNCPITSLDCNADASLLAFAPQSQLLKVADGKPVSILLPDGESDIEALLFVNELNVLVTGSLSGQLCVWDLAKQALRHHARIECAVTVLKQGLNGAVFVGATDGAVYVCDIRTGTLIQTLTGHKAGILSLSVTNDGSSILTTSDDNTAKIFKMKT